MTSWTAERMAKIGIGVQLLILIRLPAEVFRLKYVHGGNLSLPAIEPLIRGELITAVCTALAVMLYFWKKHEATIWIAVLNVASLVVYKAIIM